MEIKELCLLIVTVAATVQLSLSNASNANRYLDGYGVLTKGQDEADLTHHRVLRSVIKCELPDPGNCDFDSKYRTPNGSCNNKEDPSWGMTGIPEQRFIKSAYDDNFGSPRTRGVDNSTLSNPRNISNQLLSGSNNENDFSNEHTLLFVMFGQFLDHDITLTPEGNVDDCCHTYNEECFNININFDDPHFEKGYCMEFKRSAHVFCPNAQGKKRRQQINDITSFIDASNVYGSSSEEQKKLRENDGYSYLLKTAYDPNQPRKMRIADGPNDRCEIKVANQKCALAGDVRANEISGLTAMHTAFVLEHNRLARKLRKLYKPKPDNETLFQETRKIVGALIQKITYDDFLPCLLSPKILKEKKLETKHKYTYDSKLNPTIMNEFAAAAFRFGHSMVPHTMDLFAKNLKPRKPPVSRRLRTEFFNPDLTYENNGFEGLAYYLTTPAQKLDSILVKEVQTFLFDNIIKIGSHDLGARNIQRGRDHGLPPYNKFRKACGLKGLKRNWGKGSSGLTDHTPELQDNLQEAYPSSPRDIDLFVGGLSEKPVKGGTVGPTFNCIIAEQFRRLKYGDRYFFQNKDATGFTNDQIDAIQKYTFAGILCKNYRFKKINCPNAFKLSDPLTKCSDIHDLNLEVFKPKTEH